MCVSPLEDRLQRHPLNGNLQRADEQEHRLLVFKLTWYKTSILITRKHFPETVTVQLTSRVRITTMTNAPFHRQHGIPSRQPLAAWRVQNRWSWRGWEFSQGRSSPPGLGAPGDAPPGSSSPADTHTHTHRFKQGVWLSHVQVRRWNMTQEVPGKHTFLNWLIYFIWYFTSFVWFYFALYSSITVSCVHCESTF